MSDVIPLPGRGLEYVRPMPPDEDGNPVFEAFCDCGATTELHLEIGTSNIPPGGTGSQEMAFTCHGCGTAHWFKITAEKAADA